jgi:hypothetical protein
MSEVKTKRVYQERFFSGFDRRQLREEVSRVKPSKRSILQKKATSWALGGALALGGLGVRLEPRIFSKEGAAKKPSKPAAACTAADIQKDLETARMIASQVSGGVNAAVGDVTGLPRQLDAVSEETPAVVTSVAGDAADLIKEHFFRTQVPFGQLIYQEAKKNSLPPELLAAVVHAESRFLPNARSQSGAIGLMQLVPRTGRWLGARDLTNPQQNITAGAKYLRYLTDRFKGDPESVIAAYNAGEGNVRRFGGMPPFRETQSYLIRVQSYQSELTERIAAHDVAELR